VECCRGTTVIDRTNGAERSRRRTVFGSYEPGRATPREDGHRPTGRSRTKPGEDGHPVVQPKRRNAEGVRSSGHTTTATHRRGWTVIGRSRETGPCRAKPAFGSVERSAAPSSGDGHRPLPRNGAMPSEAGLRVGGTKRGTVEWGRSSAGRTWHSEAEHGWFSDRRTGAAPAEGRRPSGRPTEAKHRRGRAVGLPAKRPRRRIAEGRRSSAAPAKRRHTERNRPSGRPNEERHHGTGTVIGRTIEVGLYRGMQAKHHGSPGRTVTTAKALSRGPGPPESAVAASAWRQRRVGRSGSANASASAGAGTVSDRVAEVRRWLESICAASCLRGQANANRAGRAQRSSVH